MQPSARRVRRKVFSGIHMSIRVRIFCIIVALALLTIAAGVGTGSYLTRKRIIQLEENSLLVVANLANALISSKLDFLKTGAQNIALEISLVAEENGKLEKILQKHCGHTVGVHDSTTFSALTVVERDRDEKEKFVIAASWGDCPVSESLLLDVPDYIVKAFDGEFVLSTTVEAGRKEEKKLVFFVCAPVHQQSDGTVAQILCASLDGMYFTELFDEYRIWDENGDIVLCDGEGCVIASIFHAVTAKRLNYIKDAERHPELTELKSLAEFFQLMVDGKSGRNVHTFQGQQRVGFYRPITGTKMGWSLSVTAPTESTPQQEATRGLIAVTLVCLATSCIVAVFASGYLVKPYEEAFRAKEAAEKASESKSTFLANMSHEMRTPLNAIIGLTELAIGSEETKGEVAVNLEKIYNSGVILLGTINDLLDISKIESGKFELVPVEYDIPSLINDTAALNSVRIGSFPIQFTLNVDEKLPSRFLGDELRIKQMLNNLLSNAIKYTREGQVTWYVSGEWSGEDFFLIFKVSDTGIGIREEDISVLFTEYHQIDSKANRKIEGTGLGLALVKKMAGLMGGTITVESEYGKGSTFTLRIQQKPLTAEPIGKDVAFNLMRMRFSQSKLARNARLTRLKLPYARVLVVDDVQTNLDVTRGMLKPYEMQVDCVTSGQQAIDAMRDQSVQYSAIFMDHMMPEMDGIEAARRIREIGTSYANTIPIIALTANAIVGNDEMFLRNGFQAFLSKPIDIMRLDVEIRRWVRDRSQETSLSAAKFSSPNAAPSSPQEMSWEIDGVDKKKGLAQFGSEGTFFAVLQSFVTNTPGLLDKIRTCTEAQLPDYTLLVHGIKGTCFGICADTVGKQAEALEHAAHHGNFQFVSEHNDKLIEEVEQLIRRIDAVLQNVPLHAIS